ncbi:MAG: mechanosensitive ion channel [Proteobacteria bacterium]|nr:mechanosensitive ion channel [Pseudomonadota bacterium]
MELIQGWLINVGLGTTVAEIAAIGIALTLVILLSIISDLIAKRMLLAGIGYIISRTGAKWDDILLERKVFNKLAHLAPAMVIYLATPLILKDYTGAATTIMSGVMIYIIVMGMLVLDALLNAILDIYQNFEVSKEVPIKGFVQVLKIVVYFLAGILIIARILDKSPLYLLSGLGALTAVLMLVFKDVILGFVAGIQLNANKMIANGDWIEMPQYGADGDVLEVALTTVKVQNWDKTITTIPTYALISGSFKNWRGMSESGGRRIKRAVNIDMSTVKFCTDEMLKRFSSIQYISGYIDRKTKEIAEDNRAKNIDESDPANGRRLTNIGTFRAYAIEYLKHHPMINQDMTFIVRQLAPTQHGLPLEIYIFCKDKVWANYEAIQSDIFDHILAVIPEFDLKVFQNPTGNDFKRL